MSECAHNAPGGDLPRLLLLTPDMPPARGGIQALVGGLLGAIRRFEVAVVAPASPDGSTAEAESSWRVRRVRADPRLGAARNIPLNLAAVREARRYAPHAILNMHIVTSPACALIGAPTALYLHANEIGDKPRLTAFAARRSSVCIAVSAYTESLLRTAGAVPNAIARIPPGVDLPEPSLEPGARDGPPTIVTVARMAAAYKGHDVMLRSLARVRERVPDVLWIVIGDGPLRSGLEAQAAAAGLSANVRFLGSVGDEERDRWLARADVFAMPSRLPGHGLAGEGFGIVYMEAAARGLPVVAGNVAGALDAVADGETGLLVDPTDETALAGALERLLLDPQLAQRLGAAGAARARSFAWPQIAARVEDLLLALLDEHTGARA